jgi:hypothetical protein
VTNDFYHRKRENAHTGIRGRGERGRPVREGPWDALWRCLWWPSSGEGDVRGRTRGGQETRKRYCVSKDLATKTVRTGRRGWTRSSP